jgi:phage baseplate assembly protein W
MIDYGNTILLDANGDIQFDALKQIQMTQTNADKVKQDAKIILKTIFTEDIFNPGAGFDLLKIKQYAFNKQLIEAEVRAALKKYKYLKSIDRVEVGQPDADRIVPISVQITATNDLRMVIGVSI